ncbi:MAG: SUMF1/EgtB/PvdO family nonheme iron enzyme [Spirochaetia bacterium]|jgi:hypothetical protein|nr:SUMF1/EgtB/PvdO family nonheme iron enzyme [Spirochaetia bacterium]
MNDDKMITQHDIDEASVRLKSILGITPRVYLAGLYGAAVLILAALLLLYPGLRRPGVTFSFIIDPPGSAVYIDDVYKGSAPCDVFVANGDKSIRIERPGFQVYERSISVKGRFIGTLFVKPRTSLTTALEQKPDASILADGMKAYAAWALAGTPSESYQLPMVLSEAAIAASTHPETMDSEGLAGAALSYSANAPSLRDGIRATAIAYGKSASLTPLTLGRIVKTLETELSREPGSIAVLASLAPESLRKTLEAMPAYKAILEQARSMVETKPTTGPSSFIAGEEFLRIEPGFSVIKAGASLPVRVPLASYLIASSETTVGQFRRFVAAHPEWRAEAVQNLNASGLADSLYLKGFNEADDEDVLRYVSRPAAMAYCAWLSRQAPKGYRFTLPSEAQWALAAAASGASASKGAILANDGRTGPVAPIRLPYDAAGLKGMLGNVWEWCLDSYATNPAAGSFGRELYPSEEAVVRGGCWANRQDLVNLTSRGAMRETECSAHLGFRIVLVEDSE